MTSDRPPHYDGDECMQVLEAPGWGRVGCLFNIGKYLWRIGRKGSPVEDAKKVLWYAERFRDTGCVPLNDNEIAALEQCWEKGIANITEAHTVEVFPIIAQAWRALELDA